ncbi:glycosyltransferase family 25 protein [Roseovarius azorensis]|nr:glycosyltransferase family 25 protein [Roseovarius azorensis]
MDGHAFVLHLARATARRDNAHALLAACGLAGEIWSAVDGAAMSSTDLAVTVGADLFAPAYPFSLRAGEIGCFLSHRQIWAEIVRRNLDYGLILEDDVALDTEIFGHALSLAVTHIAALGYIQLQNRMPHQRGNLIDTRAGSMLSIPVVTPLRASTQLVSQKAARHLLHLSDVFDRPVDTFVQSHWHTRLRPGVIYPAGVRTISDQLEGSTIQGRPRTLRQRLFREVARSFYRRRVMKFSKRSAAQPGSGFS